MVKNTKLYNEVRDLDLIAREFKVHKNCYQDFTHGATPQNSPHPYIYEKKISIKLKNSSTTILLKKDNVFQ